MKKNVMPVLICLLVIGLFASPVFSQTYTSKLDYYNNVLVPLRGLKPLPSGDLELYKPGGFLDRKRSVLDVGNIIVRISNGATLGYDRWGKCWEYPANSGFTYRWCMAPLMGGIINGNKSVASGTRGAARWSEEEFQPLAGYDAGYEDATNNIGIATSDVPESWSASWPTGPGEPTIGDKGFPGVSWLTGNEGNIVATREMFFAVTENDPEYGNRPNPLNIRIDIWALQWDDFINQDFIIFRMKVTNIGTTPIQDFYIGMHDDPDTPEQGSQEWTDDYAAFIQQGADVDAYTDKEDSLLWNFSYLWDGNDRVEGFMASNVPWVGLKVLETPENPNNPGQELGLTTLDVFPYSLAPATELEEYTQLEGAFHVFSPTDTAGVMGPVNIDPDPDDWTQTPNTYGPDITYVFASGPFQFNPGDNLTFALASVHAPSKASLLLNAMRCQTLWNASLLASEAPPQPIVRAIAEDRKVSLYWGNESETGHYQDGHINDKQTGNNAFQGYKVYKSLDRGLNWGTPITDINGSLMGYIPLAQYDLIDGINGESTTRRFFQLGKDTGLRHYYVDQNVSNGFEYWYAVNAYDSDDGAVPPLENSIKTDAKRSDTDNTVAVIPQRQPSGTTMSAAAIDHTSGASDLDAFDMKVLDAFSVTGKTYTVQFTGDPGATSFSILDGSTPVTDEVTGQPVQDFAYYDAELDNAPIFDGIRIEIVDVEPGEKEITGTSEYFNDFDNGYEMWEYDVWQVVYHDFEIEFTPETYLAVSLWGILGYGEPDIQVPFKVTDLTTGEQLTPIFYDRGSYNMVWDWEGADRLIIQQGADYASYTSQADFGGNYDGQVVQFEVYGTGPAVGDKITIVNNKVITTADVYTISTTKNTESTVTAGDLADIQAVPNPFIVSSRFETGAYGFQKLLEFHQLPAECTIRIYNIAGDFIRELVHNGGSVESWDLQNYNGQEVAFGTYLFHVKAPGVGEHIGKFAVIK